MIRIFRSRSPRQAVALVCLAASLAGGCSKFDMSKSIPWGVGEDGRFQTPMKVVAVWTDTVLTQGMAPATRGFGGRLMFYAVDGGKPIKARGTLTVYAFDETGRDVEATRPDRKFVFTPDQFEKHYSKSALGHSYSVWLPWDAAGGPLREISLLVRFQPEQGGAVIGEPSKQHLPGMRADEQSPVAQHAAPPAFQQPPTAGIPAAHGVRQVAYEQPLVAEPVAGGAPFAGVAAPAAPPDPIAAARRMTTTTIALPSTPQARRHSALAQSVHAPGSSTPAAPHDARAAATSAAPYPPASSQAPASPQAQPPAEQSSGHYGPQRLRPLGAPIARLARDHVPWQPPRLESQPAPPFAPQ